MKWPTSIFYVVIVSFVGFSVAGNLSLIPNVIYGVIGSEKSITATCSLSEAYAVSTGFNSSRLVFIIHLVDGSEMRLPDGCRQIINNTSVQLHYKNIHSSFRGSKLACSIIFGGRSIKQETVTSKILLEDELPPPVIVDHHVNNWKHLYFEWDVNISATIYKPVRYFAWFRNSLQSEYKPCMQYVSSSVCVVEDIYEKAAADTVMIIKVNATNELGNMAYTELILQLQMIAKPDKVDLLMASPEATDSTVNLMISFESPNREKEIIFILTVNCDSGSYAKHDEIGPYFGENSVFWTMRDLPAYANCSLSVLAKPARNGYPGAASIKYFMTPELVPLDIPPICKSCFEVRLNGNTTTRDVVLNFQPLTREKARGCVVKYRVELVNRVHSVMYDFDAGSRFSVVLQDLLTDVPYVATLRAGNHKGFNDSLSGNELHIPRLINAPIMSTPVAIVVNESAVRLQWFPVGNASSYCVFWCIRAPVLSADRGQCADGIKWNDVQQGSTNHIVKIPSGFTPRDYMFGVSVEVDIGLSSGIMWSVCIYDRTAEYALPPVINVINGTDCCSLTVTLSLAKCSDVTVHGIVVSYNVYYCVLDSHSGSCSDSLKSVKVDARGSSRTYVETVQVTLTDLTPATSYVLFADSFTVAGTWSIANTSVVTAFVARGRHSERTVGAIFGCAIGVLLVIAVVVFSYSAFRLFSRRVNRQAGSGDNCDRQLIDNSTSMLHGTSRTSAGLPKTSGSTYQTEGVFSLSGTDVNAVPGLAFSAVEGEGFGSLPSGPTRILPVIDYLSGATSEAGGRVVLGNNGLPTSEISVSGILPTASSLTDISQTVSIDDLSNVENASLIIDGDDEAQAMHDDPYTS